MYKDDEFGKKYGIRRPMSIVHFLSVLGLIIVVFAGVIVIERLLPEPIRIADEHFYPDRFVAERAYNFLKNLTDIGPRIAGSRANEVLAVQLLLDTIRNIMKDAHRNHIIELDVQKVSGAFNLAFLDGMTNVYRDLQNVVVKVGSKIASKHSLLLNCHFDSVVESPGASDDGAGCAVMLEIFRVITRSPSILRHNIIFLFNGGEENFMPASHGFITKHRWAPEVRTFINLEACGAGGREVLFQAGPQQPWTMESYAQTVPYPYASSLAQEIFQSGVIPGDTDFRIFRDFGHLSGLDFAWSTNGYVYHTKFDTIEFIPLGSLQRTGDNILALSRGMAQGHQLADVVKTGGSDGGNLVFFDFLGAFVVRWSMSVADVINLLSVIGSVWTVWGNVKGAVKSDDRLKETYIKRLLGCVCAVIVSWLVSILTSVLIATFLTNLGRTMSWYARPLWAFFLYVLPTLLVSMAVLLAHAKIYQKIIYSTPWTVFQLYYDAYQLIWTVVLLLGVATRVRSSFIALLWVFPSTLGNLLKKNFTKWPNPTRWLLMHISLMGLSFVQCFYLTISALYLFIPIMGRAGATSHAEFLIAGMISILFTLLFSYVTPLILLVRGAERVFSLLTGVFLLALAVLILTPCGFPYSGDASAPAPQRFMIAHTRRIIHNGSVQVGVENGAATLSSSGRIELDESGYWIVDMDINSPKSVEKYVPEVGSAVQMYRDCDRYLYCGLPYPVPVLNMLPLTHWIPARAPPILKPVKMVVVSKERLVVNNRTGEGRDLVERVRFRISGPSHIQIIFSPMLGVKLVGCSLFDGDTDKGDDGLPLAGPKWQGGRDTYFVFYNYGLVEPSPLEFTLDLKVETSSHARPLMDLAVNSQYLFEPGKSSESFRNFIEKFPPWTAVSFWTATYESWKI